MTWVDLTLVLTVAAATALAAERRLAGMLVGLGAVLALRPLLLVAQLNPWLGLVGALLVGLVLALIGRQLLPLARVSGWATRLAGGVGGAALGIAIVTTLVTSLPIQRNPVEPGLIYYPPRDLPPPLQQAVAESELVTWGRSVLLFPLLDAQGAIPGSQRATLAAFHGWFVVGEPWRTDTNRTGP
jgi:uncharacterized membrane protein YeaQ/YmgE (transglycosylase-associated protein family)